MEIDLWANDGYHLQYTGGVNRQLSIADSVHCIYIEIMILYIFCAIDLQDYSYYQLTTPVNIDKTITLTCSAFDISHLQEVPLYCGSIIISIS